MILDQVIFLITAVVVLTAAILVVSVPKMIHAALWLILALAGIAVLFVLLQAPFFAVVQVIVYIGAIAVLVIFAVMLTRKAMQDDGPQLNRYSVLAAAVSLMLFAVLTGMLLSWDGANNLPVNPAVNPDTIVNLGESLTNPQGFLLPFEVASILLLAALVGAIFIGREHRAGKEEE
jgi:NADH-quinone oxidoreductase subunit J